MSSSIGIVVVETEPEQIIFFDPRVTVQGDQWGLENTRGSTRRARI